MKERERRQGRGARERKRREREKKEQQEGEKERRFPENSPAFLKFLNKKSTCLRANSKLLQVQKNIE